MANKVAVFACARKPGIVRAGLSLILIQTVISLEAQTWTSNNVPRPNWSSCASSSDGAKLAAAAFSSSIYVSTNSGATWNATTSPSTTWTSIASSADGSVIIVAGGFTFVSTNSGGEMWKVADLGNWVACSSD